jgi:hypothetical protein
MNMLTAVYLIEASEPYPPNASVVAEKSIYG